VAGHGDQRFVLEKQGYARPLPVRHLPFLEQLLHAVTVPAPDRLNLLAALPETNLQAVDSNRPAQPFSLDRHRAQYTAGTGQRHGGLPVPGVARLAVVDRQRWHDKQPVAVAMQFRTRPVDARAGIGATGQYFMTNTLHDVPRRRRQFVTVDPVAQQVALACRRQAAQRLDRQAALCPGHQAGSMVLCRQRLRQLGLVSLVGRCARQRFRQARPVFVQLR